MSDRDKQLEETARDVRRLEEKEKQPAGLFGIMFYGGTVGLLFVTPIVAGAYLGRWIDSMIEGYSVRWTISLIVLGIALGAYNAYRYIRDRS